MFTRKQPKGHEHSFDTAEEVEHYASHMDKSNAAYKGFLHTLKSAGDPAEILDVGAGPGIMAAKVAAIYPESRITALEISSAMADYGRDYMKRNNLDNRVDYIVGDAVSLESYKSLGKFDLVYSTYCLHHFSDLEKTIKNLAGVIKPGGKIYLFDFRRAWWMYIIPIKSGFFNAIRASYKPDELKYLIQSIGLKDVSVKRVFPFMLAAIIKT